MTANLSQNLVMNEYPSFFVIDDRTLHSVSASNKACLEMSQKPQLPPCGPLHSELCYFSVSDHIPQDLLDLSECTILERDEHFQTILRQL